MDTECTLHIAIVLAIYMPKIIKFGGDLTKFWQKTSWVILLTHPVQLLCATREVLVVYISARLGIYYPVYTRTLALTELALKTLLIIMVDHDCLILWVLQHRFSVSGDAMTWFRSYLADTTRTLIAGEDRHGPLSVNCSVPQGSVLGSNKFIAYIWGRDGTYCQARRSRLS